MSLREKTRATLERGKENRGDFTPKPGSVPVKLYNYWLEESNSEKARAIRSGKRKENFCHYWRVVAIWAPFRGLVNGIESLAVNPITWVVIVALLIAGLVLGSLTVSGFFIGLLTLIGILLAVVLTSIGILFAGEKISNYVKNKHPNLARKINNFFSSLKFWGGVGLAILGVVIYATSSGHGVVGYLVWTGCLMGVATIAFIIYMINEYIEGQAALRQAAWDALDYKTQNEIIEWELAVRRMKRTPSRLENRIRAILSGIGDLITFVIQVVRVNKWKICPLVEIDNEKV